MRTRTGTVLPALASLVAALALAGCGSSSDSGNGTSGTSGTSGPDSTKGTINVLGAASLTGTFTELAKDFEADHPGVKVKLAFDSSATLAEQVTQGAPADVLATADEDTMKTVSDAGDTAATPQLFATNHLQLVVPKDNPASITKFADLDKPGVKYVVCVDTAPCGKLAVKVLANTGITAKPVSEEVDVKAVLSKVSADEADAGLVYRTDAVAGGDTVKAVDIPTSNDNLNSYPIAALKDSKKPKLAQQFVDLVHSAKGQQVLADAGFGKP
jgi:molybdate transport system substrate-binding protein